MQTLEETDLIKFLIQHPVYKEHVVDELAIPLPYFIDIKNVKAIVLGTDPTNFQNKLDYVFDLHKEKSPYFEIILENLEKIGISKEQIYVQNLCKNYFIVETSKNPHWTEIAKLWAPILKKELDSNFPIEIPVFITAGKLVFALTSEQETTRYKFKKFYDELLFIDPDENALGRLIIPLFRHQDYRLAQWEKYKEHIKATLK